MNKKEKNNIDKEKMTIGQYFKEMFNKQTVKSGTYTSIFVIIVLALVVIVNLIVGKLDISTDLSTAKLYTLSDTSKEMLKNVKNNITIYYVTKPDEQIDEIYKMVKKYESENDKVKVVLKNPIIYPNFVDQYVDTDTETVDNNSLIIVNEDNKKSKYIAYNSLFETQMDSSYTQETVTGIDIEGQIASAIGFVTAKSTAKIYFSKGHGEAESFGSDVSDLISKQNAETDTINLLSDEKIPDDCKLIVINTPTVDFTEDEVKKVEDYIDAGKSVMLIMGYQADRNMNNLDALLEYYCLTVEPGLVMENDTAACYQNSPYYLLPTINTSTDITGKLSSTTAAAPIAFGLKQADTVSSDITINDILSSTDTSYAYTGDPNKSIEDITDKNSNPGPFMIGASVEKALSDGTTGKLVVYSSAVLFDENTIAIGQCANGDLAINSIKWLADIDSTTSVSIPAKSTQMGYITVSDKQASRWSIVLMLILPVAVLATGIVIWNKRRKR